MAKRSIEQIRKLISAAYDNWLETKAGPLLALGVRTSDVDPNWAPEIYEYVFKEIRLSDEEGIDLIRDDCRLKGWFAGDIDRYIAERSKQKDGMEADLLNAVANQLVADTAIDVASFRAKMNQIEKRAIASGDEVLIAKIRELRKYMDEQK
jgi:hypothetical protein